MSEALISLWVGRVVLLSGGLALTAAIVMYAMLKARRTLTEAEEVLRFARWRSAQMQAKEREKQNKRNTP